MVRPKSDSSTMRAEMQPFAPVVGIRASILVVEQIREAFFSGMKPGDWLGTEGELAKRFGVSRLTMRDAVRTLESYGMVEVKVGAGGGLRIAKVEPKHVVEALAVQMHLLGADASELAQVVGMLEPHAARLAAERRTNDQLAELREALEAHVDPREDPVAFHMAAAKFHALIAEASGNQPLYAALRAMRINEEHLLEPEAVKIGDTTLWLHQKLYEAIAAQEADVAESLMRTDTVRMMTNLASPQSPIARR